jgi:hypothetical protein
MKRKITSTTTMARVFARVTDFVNTNRRKLGVGDGPALLGSRQNCRTFGSLAARGAEQSRRDRLGVLPAGGLFANLSSTTAELASELVEVGAGLEVGVLDLAMSESTEQAEAGHLVLLVGGDEALLEEMRPSLAPIAKTVLHIGAWARARR